MSLFRTSADRAHYGRHRTCRWPILQQTQCSCILLHALVQTLILSSHARHWKQWESINKQEFLFHPVLASDLQACEFAGYVFLSAPGILDDLPCGLLELSALPRASCRAGAGKLCFANILQVQLATIRCAAWCIITTPDWEYETKSSLPRPTMAAQPVLGTQ